MKKKGLVIPKELAGTVYQCVNTAWKQARVRSLERKDLFYEAERQFRLDCCELLDLMDVYFGNDVGNTEIDGASSTNKE